MKRIVCKKIYIIILMAFFVFTNVLCIELIDGNMLHKVNNP